MGNLNRQESHCRETVALVVSGCDRIACALGRLAFQALIQSFGITGEHKTADFALMDKVRFGHVSTECLSAIFCCPHTSVSAGGTTRPQCF